MGTSGESEEMLDSRNYLWYRLCSDHRSDFVEAVDQRLEDIEGAACCDEHCIMASSVGAAIADLAIASDRHPTGTDFSAGWDASVTRTQKPGGPDVLVDCRF